MRRQGGDGLVVTFIVGGAWFRLLHPRRSVRYSVGHDLGSACPSLAVEARLLSDVIHHFFLLSSGTLFFCPRRRELETRVSHVIYIDFFLELKIRVPRLAELEVNLDD